MKQQRSGFTLVELLVVITIIGILMGLLIPAVQSARETARRNQCSTQIKNLALAAIQRADAKGELPGYVQSYGIFGAPITGGGLGPASDPSDPTTGTVPAHMKIGTWAVALLPYLDAQPTYEHWSEDRYPIIHSGTAGEHEQTNGQYDGDGFHTLAAPNLPIMQCPSNGFGVGDNAKNSYIANNGMVHLGITPATGATTGPLASGFGLLESQSRANGAFNCKYNVTAVGSNLTHTNEGPAVRLTDFKDGAGNTLLFSENIQALPWHRAGLVDATDFQLVAATDKDVLYSVESARYIHGMCWHYRDSDGSNMAMMTNWNRLGTASPVIPGEVFRMIRVNGGGDTVSDEVFNKTLDNANDARLLCRPSSAHVDGANAATADGGTRYLSNGIDYRVYQALLTPRGKSSDVPWPEYVLDAEAI